MLALVISSCSDTTDTVGNTLTSDVDRFTIQTDTFDITTKSIAAGSVLSRSVYTYLGRIKDPETGTYITCDYATQFSLLENEASKLFENKDSIVNRDGFDEPQVDSCYISILLNSYQGDSLAAMKLSLQELGTPMKGNGIYYTDFDPEEMGFVRTDDGAVKKQQVYAVTDLTLSDSVRGVSRTSAYYEMIRVFLNDEYQDKEGKKYNNYGTYIMQSYYKDKSKFKNFNTFVRNVCPGFYLKTTDGQGVVLEVAYTQLVLVYRYKNNGKVYRTTKAFNATAEVLQATHIRYDQDAIDGLVETDTCTFLKTPAGIYTEVTLPIDDIKKGHESDTITSAKVSFSRMRPKNDISEIMLEEPTSVLLVEKDSLYSFFENNGTPDSEKVFLATYNSSQKTYSFNNISSMINRMYARRGKSEDWNKAVLIPVQVTTSGSTSSTSTVSDVSNEMNVNSVRLVGGPANSHAPIRMSVIYNVNK